MICSCCRIMLPALLVSLFSWTTAFTPNAVGITSTITTSKATATAAFHRDVDGRRRPVQHHQHHQQRKYHCRRNDRVVSPCFVQTSLDESTATTSSSTSSSSSSSLPTTKYTVPPSSSTVVSSQQQQRLVVWSRAIINGIFLIVCFGYALYVILTIDHGMTRGWTQGEIAMRIPVDNWTSYEAALLDNPIGTKTTINVIIYLLGDWLSQTIFCRNNNNILDFDISRTIKNGLIGLCFGPLVHEYYEFSDAILPVDGGIANRATKILMDQTLYLTVKCSLYISAVGLLGGDDWPTVQTSVKEKIGPVVVTAWKFWPLVHCITYGLIPSRHRILWVNCVDLVWNAILASKAQDDEQQEQHDDEKKEQQVKDENEEPVVMLRVQAHCEREKEELIHDTMAATSTTMTTTPEKDEHASFEVAIQGELDLNEGNTLNTSSNTNHTTSALTSVNT